MLESIKVAAAIEVPPRRQPRSPSDDALEVTASGDHSRSAFGVDLRLRTRRIFCQPCLDWSERRYHLKGLVQRK
jgi:hypothetical protein